MHESGRIARLVAKLDIRIGSEWNLLPEFAKSFLKFSDRWPAVNIFLTCSPKLLGTWFGCTMWWPLDLPPNSGKEMQDYHRAVLCNINNDYRRNLRQRAAPQANSNEEVKLADGPALDPPGKDEIIPEAPERPISYRPRTGTAPPRTVADTKS